MKKADKNSSIVMIVGIATTIATASLLNGTFIALSDEAPMSPTLAVTRYALILIASVAISLGAMFLMKKVLYK